MADLLVVAFHYVGMPAMPHAGIHGLTAEGFAEAAAALAASRTPVGLDAVKAALRGEAALPDDACLITFDDGLRCQFEVALPILDRMKIPSVYFALGAPYAKGRAALVHKLHYVRARFGDEAVKGAIGKLVTDGRLDRGLEGVDEQTACAHYRYDSPGAAVLKYFMNYLAPAAVTEAITDELLASSGISEQDFIADLYMTPEMLHALGGRSILGSHGASHRPLALMREDECRDELEGSRAVLEEITGRAIDTISYPLGNADAVNINVARLAAEAGYVLGWTMERAVNKTLNEPLLLGRIDASDLGSPTKFGPRRRYVEDL